MRLFYLFLLTLTALFGEGADIVVCSFNRPLQAYALLESFDKWVTGYNKIFVICRSDAPYSESYKIVEEAFPHVEFIYQSVNNVENSFKPIVLDVLYEERSTDANYFLFAMDDMVILDRIDLIEGCRLLNSDKDVHGFYYRLGKNITKAEFIRSTKTGIPPLKNRGNDIFSWDFSKGHPDWRYPNTLDFTLYRKSTFKNAFYRLPYKHPNSLEGELAGRGPKGKFGLCYGHSKMVNMPMNRVNTDVPNDIIGNYSAEDLLKVFLQGKKMDILSIDNSKVESVHQDMHFTFIDR